MVTIFLHHIINHHRMLMQISGAKCAYFCTISIDFLNHPFLSVHTVIRRFVLYQPAGSSVPQIMQAEIFNSRLP